jgi:hypothetical protein
LTFSSDESWFHLHGNISSQNNRYWSLIHEVPLHDVISAYLNGTEYVFHSDSSFSTSYKFVGVVVFMERYLNRVGKMLQCLPVSRADRLGSPDDEGRAIPRNVVVSKHRDDG